MSQPAAPEHFKPFDIELAKQGVPYKLLCGWDVEIFKFDARGPGGPIVGICGADDRPSSWRADGAYSIVDNPRMALVHPPLGYVDERPVYFGDILIDEAGIEHPARVSMRFSEDGGWRWAKPKVERIYPRTRMESDQLHEYYLFSKGDTGEGLVEVANRALRHAVDSGQIMVADEREARDIAVAQEVVKSLCLIFDPLNPRIFTDKYLLSIIARVPH